LTGEIECTGKFPLDGSVSDITVCGLFGGEILEAVGSDVPGVFVEDCGDVVGVVSTFGRPLA
jgi:hypothetical protein